MEFPETAVSGDSSDPKCIDLADRIARLCCTHLYRLCIADTFTNGLAASYLKSSDSQILAASFVPSESGAKYLSFLRMRTLPSSLALMLSEEYTKIMPAHTMCIGITGHMAYMQEYDVHMGISLRDAFSRRIKRTFSPHPRQVQTKAAEIVLDYVRDTLETITYHSGSPLGETL